MKSLLGGMGILAVVCSIFGYLLYNEIQNKVEWQQKAVEAQATVENLKEQYNISQNYADKLEKAREDFNRKTQELVNEIQSSQQKRQSERLENPYSASISDYIDFANVLCRISRQGRSESKSCDISPSNASSSSLPLVVINRDERNYPNDRDDTVDQYDRLCKGTGDAEPRPEFCKWAVVGFTPDGINQLKTWLLKAEQYMKEQRQQINYYKNVLEAQKEATDSQS